MWCPRGCALVGMCCGSPFRRSCATISVVVVRLLGGGGSHTARVCCNGKERAVIVWADAHSKAVSAVNGEGKARQTPHESQRRLGGVASEQRCFGGGVSCVYVYVYVSVCGGCGCVLVLQTSIKSRVRPCNFEARTSPLGKPGIGKLRPTTNTRTGHSAPLILPPSGPASRRSNHPQLLSILGCLGNREAWHGGNIPALQRSFPTSFHFHALGRWRICFVSLVSKLIR